MKGADGVRLPSFTVMSFTVYFAPLHSFKNLSAAPAVVNFCGPSALNLTFFLLMSKAEKSADTLNTLSGIKWLISLSLSAINLTATLCTRPALKLFCIPILRHKTGLSSKPTILSNILLACCASTKSILIKRGFATAFLMAGAVISWKTIRFVFFGSNPNTSAKCQLILSPSRSSSDASQTSLAFLVIDLSSLTTFSFSLGTIYLGAKWFFISIPISFFSKSLIWP